MSRRPRSAALRALHTAVVALARGAHGGVDVARVAALDFVEGWPSDGSITGRVRPDADGTDGVGDVVQLHAQDSRANAAAHYLLQQLTRQSLTNTA
jgi:hypothetical protein